MVPGAEPDPCADLPENGIMGTGAKHLPEWNHGAGTKHLWDVESLGHAPEGLRIIPQSDLSINPRIKVT